MATSTVPRSGSERRQMQSTVISRLRPAEREQIIAAARRRNISVSELVRTAVLRDIAVG